MDERIKNIVSINCYLAHPSVINLFSKITDREPTKEDRKEISDFFEENAPISGCENFFKGCKKENDCVWKKFL